ncbi:armadillo-type protein [Jimgerdemannia flammicorona]|uniref:Armadillo-type protein n=1 Tax=Jimgerdemannia flammicorona TaxID=994334 RepID=A0A433Q1Z2_9FUNG|nr:armadillo-type protein [Jimgerdemannia flammicorona]
MRSGDISPVIAAQGHLAVNSKDSRQATRLGRSGQGYQQRPSFLRVPSQSLPKDDENDYDRPNTVKFVDELFRQNIIPEPAIHEYIQRLLDNISNPLEQNTESFCVLLSATGKEFDHKKAKGSMDGYSNRAGELFKYSKLSRKTKSLLLDVIDLRSNGWESLTNANDNGQVSDNGQCQR